MRGRYFAVLWPLLTAACGLPIPVQLAGLAADGLSFLTTDKSVSDHGLSLVAGRDCAMYRTLTEGEPCRGLAEDSTLLASSGSDALGEAVSVDEAGFETAAGPVAPESEPLMAAVGHALPASTRLESAGAARTALYMSLGSFGSETAAGKHALRYAGLGPSVLPAKVEGKNLYRVVVGPLKPENRAALKRRIAAAGIADAWTFTQVASAE